MSAKKSPKKFLVKTLDIGSNWVYTGCRKRRKGEKRTLGVTKQIRGIVNTMYIGHCCSLLRFPFPAVSFLYTRVQYCSTPKTDWLATVQRGTATALLGRLI